MTKYIVSLASDWDEERGFLSSVLVETKEIAHTILNMKQSICEKRFGEDEQYTIDESEDGYVCYMGTIENPEPSLGWEKCQIFEVEC